VIPSNSDLPSGAGLSAIEVHTIDFFVRIAHLFGIPRSIAEIYGLLFACPQPAPTDYVRKKLRMSSGSASQGLRILRNVGAVHMTYVAGDRRDFFVAETALRKIVAGILREQIAPQFSNHEERLARLDELLDDLPASRRSLLAERVRILQGWRTQAKAVLPAVMATLKADDETRRGVVLP